jgi:NB-ARC domain-containing protein
VDSLSLWLIGGVVAPDAYTRVVNNLNSRSAERRLAARVREAAGRYPKRVFHRWYRAEETWTALATGGQGAFELLVDRFVTASTNGLSGAPVSRDRAEAVVRAAVRGFMGSLDTSDAVAVADYRSAVRDVTSEQSAERRISQFRDHLDQRFDAVEEKLAADEAGATKVSAPPVRCALPPGIADFVGRTADLRWVERWMLRQALSNSAPAALVVDGMAGTGKTALIVRVARQAADRYPDGVLFLDLFGYVPGMNPLGPGAALFLLLVAAGVPERAVPDDVAERRALWHTTMANRRTLIVFDNVHDTAQAEPLLPTAAGCTVLITSRRKLIGLPHAAAYSLDVLPRAEAHELLTAVAGADRAPDGPAVDQILQLCDRLPLAIRIAASTLAHRPGYSVDALAEDLAAERRHAEHLGGLDESVHGAVHAAIEVSYRALPTDLQRAFRRCGANAGPDLTAPIIAALYTEHAAAEGCRLSITAAALAHARRLLYRLADHNLV